jgi:hypothetical protein
MKKTVIFPKIRANQRLTGLLSLFIFSAALLSFSGCRSLIKTTVKVPVPKNIAQDQTATLDELINIAGRIDKIESLRSRLHVTLVRGIRETGILQKYRSAPGVIVLQRPDSLHLNILNPFITTSIFELVSQGDEFKAWDSRDNRLYMGKNSAKILVPANSEDSQVFGFPGRPPHIFDAILPGRINVDSPGVRVVLEEQGGMEARYYILSYSQDEGPHRSHLLRKIWVERAGLTIARRQVYAEEGKIVSDTQYSNVTAVEGFSFPLTIEMDRPLDGYSLKLELEGLRINPDITDDDFTIKHPGAEEVPLLEKR